MLAGKKIFITGGTGFFGKNLISTITKINTQLEKPIDLTILTRDPQGFALSFALGSNVRLLQGDILNPITIPNDFDYIINAAIISAHELFNTDLDLLYKMIIDPVQNIIDFAAKNTKSKLLHFSSGAVYDSQVLSENGFEEDHALLTLDRFTNPSETYALAKIHCEDMIAERLTNYVIARCFSFVGPYMPIDTNFAVGNFINDALHKRAIVIKSDGSSLRTYLYSADLIVWILVLLTEGVVGQVYNLGAEQPYSIKQLAELVSQLSGSNLGLIIEGRQKEAVASKYLPCIKKAQLDLQLDVWHDLETAIARTIKWHRSKIN